MQSTIRIGIIGDYDAASPFHRATDEALHHTAQALDIALEVAWLPTPALAGKDARALLEPCHALWCAPGSPYLNMQGALDAIRFAREEARPYLGT